MRRFELHRSSDPTGVSGTGVVAEGVEFGDGTAVVRWRSRWPTTVLHQDMASVAAIHGHGGSTRVGWLDPDGGPGEVAL
jgi:hypothetical protein